MDVPKNFDPNRDIDGKTLTCTTENGDLTVDFYGSAYTSCKAMLSGARPSLAVVDGDDPDRPEEIYVACAKQTFSIQIGFYSKAQQKNQMNPKHTSVRIYSLECESEN